MSPKKTFKEMTRDEQKKFKQRQILIEECIEKGAFNSRDELKRWMKQEFNLDLPIAEISTEYTLTENQMKLFYIWLKHFTGRGPRPKVHRARARISNAQLYRINELKETLGWSASELARFTKHTLRKKKLIASLFKHEATKLITGMERILAEQPFKKTGAINE